MLTPELIKQVKKIQLKAGHLVTDALAGNYLSAFKGRGMEFDEVRDYVPGDDVRTIDWNVTARMHTPYVKVLREEREMTIMLMVDVSPSQVFGTGGRLKRTAAAELAAVLAFVAIRSSDKVGLIVFSDHVEHFVPPKKGRGHVWSIIRSVLTHQGKGKTTDVGGALDFLMKVTSRRATCFLISDFWAQSYERALHLTSGRHDLVCVRIEDPLERDLVSAGVVAFRDAESGAFVEVDTGDPSVRNAYAAAQKERAEGLAQLCRKNGMGLVTIGTDEPVTGPLMRFLRERGRGRKRRRVG